LIKRVSMVNCNKAVCIHNIVNTNRSNRTCKQTEQTNADTRLIPCHYPSQITRSKSYSFIMFQYYFNHATQSSICLYNPKPTRD